MMCAAAAICEENYRVEAGGMHNREGKDADGLGERGGQERETECVRKDRLVIAEMLWQLSTALT